mmetsp:Transcript_10358/g.14618  ORF Transcript_10358/g.14618 Transcript_10358/m.14618 type:complete len:96 (-) Transcript_10358:619-906(-)
MTGCSAKTALKGAAVATMAVAAAVSAASECTVVPESWKLSETMKSADFTAAKMIPIDLKFGQVKEEPENMIDAVQVARNHANKHGSLGFIVRRPG